MILVPRTATTDAVIIGESLVDVVIDAGGHQRSHPGGSPLNVAIGLGRLGVNTRLVTRIGADEFGHEIVDHLTAAAVQLWPGSVTTDPTSTAVATLDESGAATYDFDLTWTIPQPIIDRVSLIHTGSIGAILQPGAAAVHSTFAAADSRTLLSFDPNIRPTIMGERAHVVATTEALARLAHVVKMSDEDAAWLYPGLAHEDIAVKFEGLGVSLFVVTRGEHGCFARSNGMELDLPAPRIHVTDTIGAGDAFMSGLLFALISAELLDSVRTRQLRRTDLEFAVRVALASAAVTVSRAGAAPPRFDELTATINAAWPETGTTLRS